MKYVIISTLAIGAQASIDSLLADVAVAWGGSVRGHAAAAARGEGGSE